MVWKCEYCMLQVHQASSLQFIGGQALPEVDGSQEPASRAQGRRNRTQHQQNLNKLAQQRYRCKLLWGRELLLNEGTLFISEAFHLQPSQTY